jgi:amino acid efflux transporter
MRKQLKKTIGKRELLTYYITSLVGVGILIVPGIAAQIAGPASIISWLLLTIISCPVAFVFAQMSIVVPDSGGIPAFVEHSFGKYYGKSLSVLLFFTMIVGNPVMGLASAHYLKGIVQFDLEWLPLIGYGFMLISIIFNLVGLRTSSKIQSIALFILISGLLIIIFTALPKTQVDYLVPFTPNGWKAVGTAMTVCFFSFLGWENVSSIAEEVKDPGKTFKAVIPWALISVGVLYLSITFVYITVVSPNMQGKDITILSSILKTVFGDNIQTIGGVYALSLLILATNSWVLGASRLTYALARDEIIFSSFSELSLKSKTPTKAILFLGLAYGVVILIMALFGSSEEWLIKIANANFLLIYMSAFVAGIRVFSSWKLKFFSYLALFSTSVFIPFFGRAILFSLLLFFIICIYIYLSTKTKINHDYL